MQDKHRDVSYNAEVLEALLGEIYERLGLAESRLDDLESREAEALRKEAAS